MAEAARSVEIVTLCETLHCLPSQLLGEDPYWVTRTQQVLMMRNELQKEKDRSNASRPGR